MCGLTDEAFEQIAAGILSNETLWTLPNRACGWVATCVFHTHCCVTILCSEAPNEGCLQRVKRGFVRNAVRILHGVFKC